MRELVVAVNNENINLKPFETIKVIKEAGFQNVFIYWLNKKWECSQEKQLKYIRDLGLNVIFAHLGYQEINSLWETGEKGQLLAERYKNDLEVCKKNDISMVVMHLTSKTIAPKYGEIGLNRIREIVNYAKELDIKVAFENNKIKGYLDYVLSNIDQDNVGACFDSGHCHAHFDDDFNFELFKNRIFALHLHDNDKTGDLHLLPFDGTVDWNWLIKKLKYCNYNGPVTLEPRYSDYYLNMSPLEFYKKGFEIAKEISDRFAK
ncbi:MAG: sugar phosphate isomerase/epimerase [Patescibacteria group bacterium]|jgi:sugar phosphate isomerase/epimerase